MRNQGDLEAEGGLDVDVQNIYIAPLKIRAVVLGFNGSIIVGELTNIRIFDGVIVIEIEPCIAHP